MSRLSTPSRNSGENHLAIQAHEAPRDFLLVDAQRVQGGGVAHFHALDERGREHALRAELPHRLRNDEPLGAREVLRDTLDIVGLEREIELVRQELFHLVVVSVEPLHRDEPLHDPHDAADGPQVEPDDAVDVAVLHLDADALAVDESRRVHLSERRARQRFAVE